MRVKSTPASRDPNRWLRRLPLVTGLLGSVLVLANRLLFTPELLASQSRSDALGILLSAVLILTGLLWQQIQPRPPQAAPLQGSPGCDWHPALSEREKLELAWASHTLLSTTAARTVVIWVEGRTLLQRGILASPGHLPSLQLQGTLQQVLETRQPLYLGDLRFFPARAEFDGLLPPGSQAVLCQPIGQRGWLILGSDRPRSFSRQERAWVAAIADKLEALFA